MQTTSEKMTGLAWMRSALSKWKPNKIDPSLHRDLKHGWMVNVRKTPEDIATAPILFEVEGIAHGRWDYWMRTALAGKLLDEPIPQIHWDTGHSRCAEGEGSGARNHLEKCLDLIPKYGGWLGWSSWQFFEFFLDWLLYGFGHPGQPELPKEPSGCEGASMRLYQYFNIAWLIAYPWDYFGAILALNSYGKSLGFYPTPMSVCTAMAQILMEGEDCRDKSTMDCCVGTGRMLLVASNYSMRLYGQDINPVVIKATLVNGYMYAPWLVKPLAFLDEALVKGHLKIQVPAEITTENDAIASPENIKVGNALTDPAFIHKGNDAISADNGKVAITPPDNLTVGNSLTELTCLPTVIPVAYEPDETSKSSASDKQTVSTDSIAASESDKQTVSDDIASGLDKWAEAFPLLFGSHPANGSPNAAIAKRSDEAPITPLSQQSQTDNGELSADNGRLSADSADNSSKRLKTVSEVVSDSMTQQAIAGQSAQVAQYLWDTVHDTENQWQFEPIKKRKRKGVDLPAQAELKPVKAASKTGKMIALMGRPQGATMAEFLEQINPNENSVRVYFGYDLKKKGYGVKEDDRGAFHLVLPQGFEAPLLT